MTMQSHTFGDMDKASVRIAGSLRKQAALLREELERLEKLGDETDLAYRARMKALEEEMAEVVEEAEQHKAVLSPPSPVKVEEPRPVEEAKVVPPPTEEPKDEPKVVKVEETKTEPATVIKGSSPIRYVRSWIAWICGIIGALVGVGFATNYAEPLSRALLNMTNGGVVALFSWLFGILFVLIGFFLFGAVANGIVNAVKQARA